MKLNALRKVGALAAVSAVSISYAVAGPSDPAPAPAQCTQYPADVQEVLHFSLPTMLKLKMIFKMQQ